MKLFSIKRRHMAVEEGQKKRADVGPVHVGVGHDDDFVIAEFCEVEILRTDPAAERGDHGADFGVLQHFLEARFFYVEDFTADRAGSPGISGRAPSWRSRRQNLPRRYRFRKVPDRVLGSRPVFRAAVRCRAPISAASVRALFWPLLALGRR